MSLFQLVVESFEEPAKLIGNLPPPLAVSIYQTFEPFGGIIYEISDTLRLRYELPRSMLSVRTQKDMSHAAKRIRKLCEEWDEDAQHWRVTTMRELILDICFFEPSLSHHFPRVVAAKTKKYNYYIEVGRDGLWLAINPTTTTGADSDDEFLRLADGTIVRARSLDSSSLHIHLALNADGYRFVFTDLSSPHTNNHPHYDNSDGAKNEVPGRYIAEKYLSVRDYLHYSYTTHKMQTECTCSSVCPKYEVYIDGPDAPPTLIYSKFPYRVMSLARRSFLHKCPIHMTYSP